MLKMTQSLKLKMHNTDLNLDLHKNNNNTNKTLAFAKAAYSSLQINQWNFFFPLSNYLPCLVSFVYLTFQSL